MADLRSGLVEMSMTRGTLVESPRLTKLRCSRSQRNGTRAGRHIDSGTATWTCLPGAGAARTIVAGLAAAASSPPIASRVRTAAGAGRARAGSARAAINGWLSGEGRCYCRERHVSAPASLATTASQMRCARRIVPGMRIRFIARAMPTPTSGYRRSSDVKPAPAPS